LEHSFKQRHDRVEIAQGGLGQSGLMDKVLGSLARWRTLYELGRQSNLNENANVDLVCKCRFNRRQGAKYKLVVELETPRRDRPHRFE
jgi:hypothetical protein